MIPNLSAEELHDMVSLKFQSKLPSLAGGAMIPAAWGDEPGSGGFWLLSGNDVVRFARWVRRL